MKELCKLPGIGKITAQKVIDNRPYNNIEELQKIPGLHDFHHKYSVLKERLAVREVKPEEIMEKQQSAPIMERNYPKKKKNIMIKQKLIDQQEKKEEKQNFNDKKDLSKIIEQSPEEIKKFKEKFEMETLQNEKFYLSVFFILTILIFTIVIRANEEKFNEFLLNIIFGKDYFENQNQEKPKNITEIISNLFEMLTK